MNTSIETIEIDLIPQVSPDDLKSILEDEAKSQKAMSVVSTTNLLLNCFLYVGLKYLWNMVNLLQFEVFMLLWQISIPYKAEAFLKYIKLLALMEFIPFEWLTDSITDLIGIECDSEVEQCSETPDDAEKQGLSKLGSSNVVKNMGIMLLVAVAILIVLIVVLLSQSCVRRDHRLLKVYLMIKKRLFWNTFIRYVLQSELKLLISACSVLALERSRE